MDYASVEDDPVDSADFRYHDLMSTKGETELTAPAVQRESLEFVALVGNPPYSVEIGAGSALSIYPEFFEVAWEVSAHASIVSPARWLTVADLATARGRVSIREKGIEREIRELFAFDDSNEIFDDISLPGGVTWWLRQRGADELTKFTWNKEESGGRSLFSEDGLIQVDNRVSSLKAQIARVAGVYSNPVIGWKYLIERDFKKAYGGNVSTKAMLSKALATRPSPKASRVRFPDNGWLYFHEGVLSEEAQVPEGKCALAFTHASHNTGCSLNDRSMFLSKRETAKATMAIECGSVEEVLKVYKFARTKIFRILVESRLSSHSTYPIAYQDVPWIFKFNESDPIDWSQSVEDIDAQLVKLFGLEEWNDFIQEVEYPFANYFAEEFLEKLNKAGADTSEIHEWYGKRLDGSSIDTA